MKLKDESDIYLERRFSDDKYSNQIIKMALIAAEEEALRRGLKILILHFT